MYTKNGMAESQHVSETLCQDPRNVPDLKINFFNKEYLSTGHEVWHHHFFKKIWSGGLSKVLLKGFKGRMQDPSPIRPSKSQGKRFSYLIVNFSSKCIRQKCEDHLSCHWSLSL